MNSSPSASWRAGAALVLLVVVLYARALACGFIWDDDDYIQNNPTLRSVGGLAEIWTQPGETPQYYPLTFTTFWVEYQLWGLHPLGYHAVNVALHAINTLLVWRILTLLGVPGAWLAAAVFGVHPVHVESVAWITERKNVLSGALALSSLLWYLDLAGLRASAASKPNAETRAGDWRAYGLSLLLFVGGLLSKTIVCSLPAVILLLVWYRRGKIATRDVVPLLPFFAVGLALALHTAWMERRFVGAEGEIFQWSFAQRLLIAGPAVWFYFWKIVCPYPLVFMYERWTLDLNGPLWWFPIGALALAVIAFVGRQRWGRGPLTGLLYFYGTLFPALGFFNVYPMRYSFVADHFQYLPSLGPIVLICAGLVLWSRRLAEETPDPAPTPSLSRREKARRAKMSEAAPAVASSPATGLWTLSDLLGAGWIALLAVLTLQQIPIYQSVETLWMSVLQHNPTSFPAFVNLAEHEAARGNYRDAQKLFEAGLRTQTDKTEAHTILVSLGNAYLNTGDVKKAEECYRQALRYEPDDQNALNALGAALGGQGRLDESLTVLREALKKYPEKAALHHNLGNALAAKGEFEAAAASYREAVRLDPNLAVARINLGMTLERLNKPDEAEQVYLALLQLQSDHKEAQARLDALRASRKP